MGGSQIEGAGRIAEPSVAIYALIGYNGNNRKTV